MLFAKITYSSLTIKVDSQYLKIIDIIKYPLNNKENILDSQISIYFFYFLLSEKTVIVSQSIFTFRYLCFELNFN